MSVAGANKDRADSDTVAGSLANIAWDGDVASIEDQFDSIRAQLSSVQETADNVSVRHENVSNDARKSIESVEISQRDTRRLLVDLIRDLNEQGFFDSHRSDFSLRVKEKEGRALLESASPELAIGIFDTYPVLIDELDRANRRALARFYRRFGYWDKATALLERISTETGSLNDARRARLWEAEKLSYMDPELFLTPIARDHSYQPDENVVLHIVGHCLPRVQSGYTVRTQETVLAQELNGWRPIVVLQPGVDGLESGWLSDAESPTYVLEGPDRSAELRTVWLQEMINSLYQFALEQRPAILHAHSDFYNAVAASYVGEALGIPAVYEQRGFWEDSWWSKAVERSAAHVSLVERIGLPDAYHLRKKAEARARNSVDHVVTLANVMATHIQVEQREFGFDPAPVSIVPNAVDANRFVHIEQTDQLKAELGLTGQVVGLISSMVPYEGIGLLVDAFDDARDLIQLAKSIENTDELASRVRARLDSWGLEPGVPDNGSHEGKIVRALEILRERSLPQLLLVGGGVSLDALAERLSEMEGIVATGRVPNTEIVEYYSMIDLFVVPRLPFEVCKLVTPLKPFEAMANSRPLLLSDVEALSEIAAESRGALTFQSGNKIDLTSRLLELLADDKLRLSLGKNGREWVVTRRTWERNAQLYNELYSSVRQQSS